MTRYAPPVGWERRVLPADRSAWMKTVCDYDRGGGITAAVQDVTYGVDKLRPILYDFMECPTTIERGANYDYVMIRSICESLSVIVKDENRRVLHFLLQSVRIELNSGIPGGREFGMNVIELIKLTFNDRPSPYLIQVNVSLSGNQDGLSKTLPVAPMIVSSKPIFNAIGWGDDHQLPSRELYFVNLFDRFFSDRQRSGWKLDNDL